MVYYKNFKKIIEGKILEIERKYDFTDKWYAIMFNPYFITRSALYKATMKFSSVLGLDKKILDVGCGSKPYQHLFKNCEYFGIDIKEGNKSDQHKKTDLFFDGENIPLENNKFDAVVCTEVFEHVENINKLINEINRVLKKGGLIFYTMPFMWPEHCQPHDFRRYTSIEHKRMLEKNNFINIKIKKTTGIFSSVGQLISDFFVNKSFNITLNTGSFSYKIEFILKRLIFIFVCFPTQAFFLFLNYIFKNKGATLDYVVTAKKITKYKHI